MGVKPSKGSRLYLEEGGGGAFLEYSRKLWHVRVTHLLLEQERKPA